MGANPRTKGQSGEREVADALNQVVFNAMAEVGIPPLPGQKPFIQRRQNQSAVGGSDLDGTMGVAIEVKRQEQLSVNTWWKQCVASAAENDDIPVLVYRQNRGKWRVVMLADIPLGSTAHVQGIRVEMEWSDFLKWYHAYVVRKLQEGVMPRC